MNATELKPVVFVDADVGAAEFFPRIERVIEQMPEFCCRRWPGNNGNFFETLMIGRDLDSGEHLEFVTTAQRPDDSHLEAEVTSSVLDDSPPNYEAYISTSHLVLDSVARAYRREFNTGLRVRRLTRHQWEPHFRRRCKPLLIPSSSSPIGSGCALPMKSCSTTL